MKSNKKNLQDTILNSLLGSNDKNQNDSNNDNDNTDATATVPLDNDNNKNLKNNLDQAYQANQENSANKAKKEDGFFNIIKKVSPLPKNTINATNEPRDKYQAQLSQAENLRIAQERILDLEREVERLRIENEELLAAGETLKNQADDFQNKIENYEYKYRKIKDNAEVEISIMKENVSSKDKENRNLKIKIEQLEMRLASDIKKIRVRERELENRLELIKMENVALARNKDETILDLKRQIDQLSSEAESYQNKCQDLYRQIENNQNKFSRTVKALRLALASLENDDETN